MTKDELQLMVVELRNELKAIKDVLDYECYTCWSNIGGDPPYIGYDPPIIDKVRGLNRFLDDLITGIECNKDRVIKELKEKHEESEKHWHEIWSRDLETIAIREKEIADLKHEIENLRILKS